MGLLWAHLFFEDADRSWVARANQESITPLRLSITLDDARASPRRWRASRSTAECCLGVSVDSPLIKMELVLSLVKVEPLFVCVYTIPYARKRKTPYSNEINNRLTNKVSQ